MPSRIVVGYEASEASRDAVRLARRLAAALDAQLFIVCAYALDWAASNAHMYALTTAESEVLGRLGEEARETLRGAAELMTGFDAWTSELVPVGSPARALHEVAERESAELVVVGSTHRGTHGRVLPGSTAERLLHGAPCAVAVAPLGYAEQAQPATSVVGVGFDGSPESVTALTSAAGLAASLDAVLRVLAIFNPPNPAHPIFAVTTHGYGELVDAARGELNRQLEQAVEALPAGVAAEREVVDGRPAPALLEASASLDLLVLGSRGYGPLRRVLLGGVSGAVVNAARCPVLVVPRGVEPCFGGHAREGAVVA